MVNTYLHDFKCEQEKYPHPTVVALGKRGAGKTHASVNFASQYKIRRWAAFCGVDKTKHFWAERFGSHASVKGPKEDGIKYLEKLIRYQQRKINQYKYVFKKPVPDKYTLGLVFDDVTADRKFRKCELLEWLFANGRHIHVFIMVTCQYVKQLPPAIRGNVDFFLLLNNTPSALEMIYKELLQVPDTFQMFKQLLRAVLSQKNEQGEKMHNTLLFNVNSESSELNEMYYILRSQDKHTMDAILLGGTDWRDCMQQNYVNPEEEAALRDHRREQRQKRHKRYRAMQMQRHQGPLSQADLDYFSGAESDSSSSSSSTTNRKYDSVKLLPKKGNSMTVKFSRGAPSRPSGNNLDLNSRPRLPRNVNQVAQLGRPLTRTDVSESRPSYGAQGYWPRVNNNTLLPTRSSVTHNNQNFGQAKQYVDTRSGIDSKRSLSLSTARDNTLRDRDFVTTNSRYKLF